MSPQNPRTSASPVAGVRVRSGRGASPVAPAGPLICRLGGYAGAFLAWRRARAAALQQMAADVDPDGAMPAGRLVIDHPNRGGDR